MPAKKRFFKRKNETLSAKKRDVHKKSVKITEEPIEAVQPVESVPAVSPEINTTPQQISPEPSQQVVNEPVASVQAAETQPSEPIQPEVSAGTPSQKEPATSSSRDQPSQSENPLSTQPVDTASQEQNQTATPIVVEPAPITPTAQSEPMQSNDSPHSRSAILMIGIGILVVIVFGAFGFLMYQLGIRKGEEEAVKNISSMNVPPTIAYPSPTSVPSITVSPSAYTIMLQNGSGISGEATKVRRLLEGQTYQIGTIGNADRSDYNQTIIQAKSTVNKAWLLKLQEFLGKTYSVSDIDVLPESSTSDVILIVGSKKATSR